MGEVEAGCYGGLVEAGARCGGCDAAKGWVVGEAGVEVGFCVEAAVDYCVEETHI